MGSCYSAQRKSDSEMKKLKQFSFWSKTEKLVIPPSPIKENPKIGNFNWSSTRSTTNFTDYGSKDETFFDSKPWLDSDCEDDFYSVNGDFTPSRGNTPVHHSFGTPSQNRTPGSTSESSSPEKKKKLLDLFRDSVRNDQHVGNGNKQVRTTTIQDVLPKSADSAHCSPHLSRANSACASERTASEDRVSMSEKSVKSSPWCIPSLSSCRSFSERRKASPAVAVNGKH